MKYWKSIIYWSFASLVYLLIGLVFIWLSVLIIQHLQNWGIKFALCILCWLMSAGCVGPVMIGIKEIQFNIKNRNINGKKDNK